VKTSEVLLLAGDVLRERGWRQGWFGFPVGPMCMLGACNFAIDGRPDGHAAVDTMPEVLDVLDVVTTQDAEGRRAIWNDSPQRTKDDVLAALDAAYVLALQEEGADLDEVFA